MRFQRFLAAMVWCLGAGLVLAAVAIAVDKWARPLPGADWMPFAIAGGIALLVAAIIAILTGPNRVDAAVAIDRAFHLNERLSTALTLPPNLRESAAGKALLADAIKHVHDLDIGEHFGLRIPHRAWVPLVPAALALGLLFAPEWTQRIAQARSKVDPAEQLVVAKNATVLSKKIAAQRKDLDKAQFAETDKLLAEIEKATKELAKSPPSEKDKALVELNKLSDALKDRQKQLGSTEQISRQLQALKDMASEGPAQDFAKELAKGDFEKAAMEMKKLQEKLASGKMTETEKKALQEQLSEMKKQLDKMANLEERRKQLEEARKNGGLSQKQFEQEMAKLDQQSKNLKQLQKLSQQMGKAQEAMQKGDMKKAAEALGMSEQQLSQMADQLQELQALDSAMAELQEAKNGMTGDELNQLGMSPDGMNSLNMGMRKGMGNGLGRGRGQGDRPEAPDNVASYNTKVKQQYGKGKAVIEGTGPKGLQTKGLSLIADVESMETAEGLDAAALSNQKIPKGIQKHILNYYDQINKGK
jgi:hypothetical protein